MLALSIWWSMVWMGLLAMMFGVMNFEQLRRLPKEVRFQRSAAPPPRRATSRRRSEAGAVSVEQLMGELRSGTRAAPPEAPAASRRAPAPVPWPAHLCSPPRRRPAAWPVAAGC